jgi:FixJ family two-component response regulator
MRGRRSVRGEIYVVDDSPVVRDMFSAVLSREGFEVICFADGESLLAASKYSQPLCMFLDVHIPGQPGLDILKELHAADYPVPVIMMSGKSDIPTAVEAIKNGAFDFMPKPFRGSDVVAHVNEAISHYLRRRRASRNIPNQFPGRQYLTDREMQVLEQCICGASSKEAGRVLCVSPRTIEEHRSNILRKVGARTMVDLTRMIMAAPPGYGTCK